MFKAIGDKIVEALDIFFGKLMYYITIAFVYILKVVNSFFGVFAGTKKVTYDGNENYLINIFFKNKSINNVYWAMALIGILFTLVFAIIAVMRKSFDLGENHQKPMSSILFNSGKSMLAILLLSFVMTGTIDVTNLLIEKVVFIFNNADSLYQKTEMQFTEEQYAAMARILNTVGNYSLNESSESRFNLNSCYNEIRADLYLLQCDGVFDFKYDEREVNGEKVPTWQSELQKLVVAYDPNDEMMIDDKNVIAPLKDLMKILKENNSFYPVSEIKRTLVTDEDGDSYDISLDRIVFLLGTLQSAKNSEYNSIDASITDAVRGPFYYGEKDIYSLSDVQNCFEIRVSGISYIMIILLAIISIKNLTVCVFNCIARLFNLLSLYVIAPPVFATMPIDEGGKFKQWVTSAIIQMFGIFGCIIPMRLVIIFVPMILDSRLVIFDNSGFLNLLAKGLLIAGAIEASNRFSGVLNGILAGSAGEAAIRSGDMSASAGRFLGGAAKVAGFTALAAANVSGLGTVGRYVGSKIGNAAGAVGDAINNRGGILGALAYGGYRMFGGGSSKKAEDGKDSSGNKPLPQNMHK